MEAVTCDYCGRDQPHHFLTGRDYWQGFAGTFTLQTCGHCGHIYLNPRPDPTEIARFYPDDYEPYTKGNSADTKASHRLGQRYFIYKQLRLVRRYLKPGQNVLEIGCAGGDFLAALRDEGLTVTGIEPNEAAALAARAHFQLNVINQPFETCDFPDNEFDGVIMWNVWEHLERPRETLGRLSRMVRPGGSLIMNVPNPASVEASLFGRFWAGWDFPRHFNIYSAPLLRTLLAEMGWRTVKIRGFGGRLWLLRLSMGHLEANHPAPPRWFPFAKRLIERRWIRLFTTPLFSLLEALNRSSIMVVVAVKEPKTSEANR